MAERTAETTRDLAADPEADSGGEQRKARRRARQARAAAEQAADDLTSRQYGAITRRQAAKLGVTKGRIDDRRLTGLWLLTEARGVFVTAASAPTPERALMVACLAGGDKTVASHLSAAALLGLARHPKVPQVTVPPTHSGRFHGAEVFRSAVPGGDRAMVGRIPCTRPARTLVDCAAIVTEEALEDLVDSAFCRYNSLTAKAVLEALARANPGIGGRKGAATLRRAVDAWSTGGRAGSRPEMRLFRRLEEWGFPPPQRQIVIRDGNGRFVARCDLGLPQIRLILEYEGDRTHTPRKWPMDDARARRVRDLGWRVEQVYKEDLWPWSTRLRTVLDELLASAGTAA